jgi:conjugal transfer ATP-binding protein TraC
MEQGFNSTLPLGNDQLAIATNLNTQPLSTTFPFVSSELTSNDGILYGINRHNNSLILFDRFQMENANSVVLPNPAAAKVTP